MMFFRAVGMLLALLALPTHSFLGNKLSAVERSIGSRKYLANSSTMTVESPGAIESLRRQMISNKKVPATVVVEERKISVIAVPSLREIEIAAKSSERSTASKTFCSRSGGYPDLDVKDGIYLLLWASMTHNLHQAQAISQQDVHQSK